MYPLNWLVSSYINTTKNVSHVSHRLECTLGCVKKKFLLNLNFPGKFFFLNFEKNLFHSIFYTLRSFFEPYLRNPTTVCFFFTFFFLWTDLLLLGQIKIICPGNSDSARNFFFDTAYCTCIDLFNALNHRPTKQYLLIVMNLVELFGILYAW